MFMLTKKIIVAGSLSALAITAGIANANVLTSENDNVHVIGIGSLHSTVDLSKVDYQATPDVYNLFYHLQTKQRLDFRFDKVTDASESDAYFHVNLNNKQLPNDSCSFDLTLKTVKDLKNCRDFDVSSSVRYLKDDKTPKYVLDVNVENKR